LKRKVEFMKKNVLSFQQVNEEKNKGWKEKLEEDTRNYEKAQQEILLKQKELEKKTKENADHFLQIKNQTDEIQLKNKRLEEERAKLETKRRDLEKEANYLEQQQQALEEFRDEVEEEKKAVGNLEHLKTMKQLQEEEELPKWKKDLLEKKKGWEDETKAQATRSKRTNSTSRTKAKEFQENSAQYFQQKAEKLLEEAYHAIEDGNMANFNAVFETKSEIDFLDMFYEGNTLLHHCVTYNRPKMALSLLGNGALFVANGLDQTPVDLARTACEADPSYTELLQLYLEWE